MRVALACLGLLLAACDGTVTLAVDLRTDLVPPEELSSVVVDRFDTVDEARRADAESPDRRVVFVRDPAGYLEGRRVAELGGLAPGRHVLRVQLMDGAMVVLEQIVVVEAPVSQAVTVVLTRDCRGVTCPAPDGDPAAVACLGGRCVDPRCTPEAPEHCPEPACESDAACPSGASCARPRCAGGICLLEGDDGACGAEQWCHPDDGCRARTAAPDGGTPDAGTLDAGAGSDGGPIGCDAFTDPFGDGSLRLTGEEEFCLSGARSFSFVCSSDSSEVTLEGEVDLTLTEDRATVIEGGGLSARGLTSPTLTITASGTSPIYLLVDLTRVEVRIQGDMGDRPLFVRGVGLQDLVFGTIVSGGLTYDTDGDVRHEGMTSGGGLCSGCDPGAPPACPD